MILLLSGLIVMFIAMGQLLLKYGADSKKSTRLINAYVLAGYAVFFLIVLVSYYLMAIIPMKNFTVIMSVSYIAVAVAAHIFLKEKINRDRVIGTLLIVVGVFVFLLD